MIHNLLFADLNLLSLILNKDVDKSWKVKKNKNKTAICIVLLDFSG